MIFYPAIDLKDGNCVRLYKGEMSQATVFSEKPSDQAHQFQNSGAKWLHLVDLNGAFAGNSVNTEAVESILQNITIPTQLGGGIRDLKAIEIWLNKGISRVILGTIAVRDPELVKTAAREFPGKIAVGIDARKGYVAVEGWAETTDMKAIDLAQKFEDAGVSAIIYTDIDRDGAMQGPNIDMTVELAEAVSIPVIASGGVSSLADLKALKTRGSTLNGVISGRALYENAFTIEDALTILESPRDA